MEKRKGTTLEEETTFIYGLWDPRNGRLRYVGKSDNPKQRLIGHVSIAKKELNPCASWIRSLLKQDLRPLVTVLEEVPVSEWEATERHWIEKCRDLGIKLTNLLDGGEGGSVPGRKHSKETREKMSRAQKGRPGVSPSQETREKIRKALKGRKLPPEHCKNISEGQIGQTHSEETKKKISAKLRGREAPWARCPRTEEQKRAISRANKGKRPRLGMKNTPEQNAKIGAANAIALKGRKVSEAEKERLRQIAKERWSRPSERERASKLNSKRPRNKKGQFISESN
jgi:group I intron endonuclease